MTTELTTAQNSVNKSELNQEPIKLSANPSPFFLPGVVASTETIVLDIVGQPQPVKLPCVKY